MKFLFKYIAQGIIGIKQDVPKMIYATYAYSGRATGIAISIVPNMIVIPKFIIKEITTDAEFLTASVSLLHLSFGWLIAVIIPIKEFKMT